jgi:S-adenosylmethionine-dependent methyltransferase
VVSVLAANSVAAVLHHALAGRFADARRLLADSTARQLAGHADERADGPAMGPDLPRRFTLPELTALVAGAGLRPGEAHGLRVFGGLVPSALVAGDAAAVSGLLALERAAAAYPPLRDIAAQLHLLGHR